MLRAYDYAGFEVLGVDTHGLAQRGGIVRSHIRVGRGLHTPVIEPGTADAVLSLERTEALRALLEYCRPGGVLVYYNAAWQPLSVRLKSTDNVNIRDIERAASHKNVRLLSAFEPDLPSVKMQNMAMLFRALQGNALPHLTASHVRSALGDLLAGKILEDNLLFFNNG